MKTDARRFLIAEVNHQAPAELAFASTDREIASTDREVFDWAAAATSSSGRIREMTNA